MSRSLLQGRLGGGLLNGGVKIIEGMLRLLRGVLQRRCEKMDLLLLPEPRESDNPTEGSASDRRDVV